MVFRLKNPPDTADITCEDLSRRIQQNRLESRRNNHLPQPLPRIRQNWLSFCDNVYQRWDGLSLQNKLVTALLGSAALPVVILTQFAVVKATHHLTDDAQKSLGTSLDVLTHKIGDILHSNQLLAINLADTAESNQLDLSDKSEAASNCNVLTKFLAADNSERGGQSFRIFVDAHGKTVAQDVRIISGDFSYSPPLNKELHAPKSVKIPLPPGIDLGHIQIVRNALSTGRLLTGTELLAPEFLRHLGLEKQANVGVEPQNSWRLSEPDQPLPQGRYDDNGATGLTIMAVKPIHLGGKVVGAAIVGTLLNRNYFLVDTLSAETGISTAALFAQDNQISTNVSDNSVSRALGTRASSKVSEAVLERGEHFLGVANMLGDNYLTAYSPLYDHHHQFNPHAKPVGMAFVGIPESFLWRNILTLALFVDGIGGVVLLLSGLMIVPLAKTFSSPIGELTSFARAVTAGRRQVTFNPPPRADEIGVLNRELTYIVEKSSYDIELIKDLEKLRYQDAEHIKLFPIITLKIRNALDLEDIYSSATEEIQKAFKIERVILYRLGDSSGDGAAVLAESIRPGCKPVLEVKIRSLDVKSNLDFYKDKSIPDCHLELSSGLTVKPNLVWPIFLNQELFGLMICYDDNKWRSMRSTEKKLVEHAATQVGMALEQASVLEDLEKERIAAEFVSSEQHRQKENLQGQMAQLFNAIEPLSRGDLSVSAVISEGEFGTVADFFNFLVESMRQLVTQVKVASAQVSSSIGENALRSASLTSKTKNQAEQIAKILAAVEDSMRSLEIVAQNARTALDFAHSVSTTAEEGGAAMDGTVQSILNLRSTVALSAAKLQSLGSSSEQISSSVFSINQIALQTNILAINLSIEAARAGEAGRGFAVVATEVGGLAGQIAAFTKQIDKNVHDIQLQRAEVASGIGVVTDQAIALGESLSDNFKNYTQIFDEFSKAEDLVQSVATSSMSQAQISAVLAQMIQALAFNSAHLSDESKHLQSDLEQTVTVDSLLQRSVGTFKLDADN